DRAGDAVGVTGGRGRVHGGGPDPGRRHAGGGDTEAEVVPGRHVAVGVLLLLTDTGRDEEGPPVEEDQQTDDDQGVELGCFHFAHTRHLLRLVEPGVDRTPAWVHGRQRDRPAAYGGRFRPGSSALYRGRSQEVAGFEPANRRHRNSSFEPMGHLVVRGATRLCAAATSELCKLLTYLWGRFGRKVALRDGRKCAQFAHCECNVARFVTPKRPSGWR